MFSESAVLHSFNRFGAFKAKRRSRYLKPILELLEDRTLLSGDVQPPIVTNVTPVSLDPDNPDTVVGTAITIRATASDQTTGNSGIRTDSFVLEFHEKLPGGQFGLWQTFTGFQTQITVSSGDANVTTLFQGQPNHIYGFRVTAVDGANNEARSEPTYAQPRIDDIEIIIVIDPQCTPTLPPEAVAIATEVINQLSVGDKVGLIVGNDPNVVTFPLSEITAGSDVRAQAIDALHGSFNRYVPGDMTSLILAAQDQMARSSNNSIRSIVVLTDGVHSKLAPALERINTQLDQTTTVYGVGYLREANQEPLLAVVRLRNGKYYFLPGSTDLADLDMRLHGIGITARQKIGEFVGSIREGEELSGRFAIGPSQRTLLASADWSAGDLDLELVGPSGTVYKRGSAQTDPNVRFIESERFESFKITAPDWGYWQVRMGGINVPGTSIFKVALEVNTGGQPLYSILDGQEPVIRGETLDLGGFAVNGGSATISLNIRNDGPNSLTLSDIVIPTAFSLIDSPSTAIAPGNSAPLTFRMNTSSVGGVEGLVSLFLDHSIGQPEDFSFMLTGTVNGSPDTSAPAPPARPDLDAGSDLGNSNNDDLTSRSTILFRGQAEPNSTLRLFDGSSLLAVAPVSHAGRWYMTVGPLSDGEHVFSAEATDAAGNVSPRSIGMSVTIDTVVPIGPQAPVLDMGSDSGVSDSDHITNIAEPELMGMGEPDGLVELFDGLNLIATTFSDGSGAWELGNWELADGIHDLFFRVKDPACNTSDISAPLRLTIDTIAPNTPPKPHLDPSRDAGTSNGDDVTNQTRLILNGVGEPNSTVELFDGQASFGTTNADGAGLWSLQTDPMPSGPHTITVQATDAAGNTSSASTGLSVLIDTIPPAATAVDLTAGSDLGKSSIDDLTSDSTPTLRGIAELSGRVELFDGARSLGTGDVAPSGAWTITSSTLADGVHFITARTMDQAGNISAVSSALRVTIDTLPPAAPAVPSLDAASDLGSSNSDNITLDATPTFIGMTSPNTTVWLFDGNRSLGMATSDAAGAWTITSSALSDGVHNITVSLSDVAGNMSAASTAAVVTIDKVVPAIPAMPDLDAESDHGDSHSDNRTNVTMPNFRGTAEAGSNVELFSNFQSLGMVQTDSDGVWNFSSAAASQVFGDGTYNIIVRSIDVAGNVGTVSSGLAITIDTLAPAMPNAPDLDDADDTGSLNSDNLTRNQTLLLRGVTDPNGTIELWDGSLSIGTALGDSSGAWSHTTEALSPDTHQFAVQAKDAAGNLSPLSIPLLVTIDITAPSVPTTPDLAASSDSGVASNDDLTSDTTPTLRGTAEPGSAVQLFEGVIFRGAPVADNVGNWNTTTAPLADGLHRLSAQAIDTAGNTSGRSAELSIQIDATPPSISHLELVPARKGKISGIVVTFSEDVIPQGVQVTENFVLTQTGTRPRRVVTNPVTISGRTGTVTLTRSLSARNLPRYQLRVSGTGALSDAVGNVLDGDRNGTPGGDAVLPLSSGVPRIAAMSAARSLVDELLDRRKLSASMHVDALADLWSRP